MPKDNNGESASGMINYASVVGMLLYLSGHTRPDLSFAVHQCARYTFAPTKRHEQALLRIGRYLIGTIDKGIYLDPTNDLHLDCYLMPILLVFGTMNNQMIHTAFVAARDS